jgi:hypothetical protein
LHELRTPQTVIRGAAHNLKSGLIHEREQTGKYSELIIQPAEQLGENGGTIFTTAAVPVRLILELRPISPGIRTVSAAPFCKPFASAQLAICM